MKEQYFEAEMELIPLDCDDVITTSSAWDYTGDPDAMDWITHPNG